MPSSHHEESPEPDGQPPSPIDANTDELDGSDDEAKSDNDDLAERFVGFLKSIDMSELKNWLKDEGDKSTCQRCKKLKEECLKRRDSFKCKGCTRRKHNCSLRMTYIYWYIGRRWGLDESQVEKLKNKFPLTTTIRNATAGLKRKHPSLTDDKDAEAVTEDPEPKKKVARCSNYSISGKCSSRRQKQSKSALIPPPNPRATERQRPIIADVNSRLDWAETMCQEERDRWSDIQKELADLKAALKARDDDSNAQKVSTEDKIEIKIDDFKAKTAKVQLCLDRFKVVEDVIGQMGGFQELDEALAALTKLSHDFLNEINMSWTL